MRTFAVAVLSAILALAATGCLGAASPRPMPAHTRFSLPRTAAARAFPAAGVDSSTVAATNMPVTEIDPAPYLGSPLKRAPFETNEVALTLDDGPSANTSEVLSIFERRRARCTFFYVGNRAPRRRVLVKRAYDEGFEIGDHTWDHHEVKKESGSFVLSEVDRCQAELKELTGHAPVFMRPPAGHWDDNALRTIQGRGLVMALWSLHGHDTGPGTHSAIIARDVIADARGGDIILLHETNPETVKALPGIIEGLRAKGLEPVTLSELLTH